MADGFVAGEAEGAEDIARGADDAFLRGGGQEGSGNVGSPISLLGSGSKPPPIAGVTYRNA